MKMLLVCGFLQSSVAELMGLNLYAERQGRVIWFEEVQEQIFYFISLCISVVFMMFQKIKQALKSSCLFGEVKRVDVCALPHFHKYLLSLFFFLKFLSGKTHFLLFFKSVAAQVLVLWILHSTTTIPTSVPSPPVPPQHTSFTCIGLSFSPPVLFWDPPPK